MEHGSNYNGRAMMGIGVIKERLVRDVMVTGLMKKSSTWKTSHYKVIQTTTKIITNQRELNEMFDMQ